MAGYDDLVRTKAGPNRQIVDAEAGNDPHGLVTFPTGLFGSWR